MALPERSLGEGPDSEEARNHGEGNGTHGEPAAGRTCGAPRGPADVAEDNAPRQPGDQQRRHGAEHRAPGDPAGPLTALAAFGSKTPHRVPASIGPLDDDERPPHVDVLPAGRLQPPPIAVVTSTRSASSGRVITGRCSAPSTRT